MSVPDNSLVICRKRIFIVEDNPDIGFILSFFLDEEGFEIGLFENIAAFLPAVEQDLPDLFLFDVMLPDGNGIGLCEYIKEDNRFAGIPVMIMSAHAPAEKISKESCADDFISKPFDLLVVLDRINAQLQRN